MPNPIFLHPIKATFKLSDGGLPVVIIVGMTLTNPKPVEAMVPFLMNFLLFMILKHLVVKAYNIISKKTSVPVNLA